MQRDMDAMVVYGRAHLDEEGRDARIAVLNLRD